MHVIAPSLAGGAESVVVALASAAKDRTHAVILNQMGDAHAPPLPLVTQLQRRGVAADEVRCGRRRYRAEVHALVKRLRDVNATLVHTHGYHATWVGYHAAKRVGIPAVATVHGYLTRSLKERLYNLLDRRLLRRFDAVIAVSQGIRDQLIRSGIDARKVHFVQNGLAAADTVDRAEARRALDLNPDQRVIGWIGRLSREKGADLFLQALALSGSDCQAVIIGDGPERPRLDELARSLGLGKHDRVRFAGHRSDAAELLHAFDVMALTSRIEGTPMVILEAIAAGVPVVAFAVGGIPDLLNSETAWLVRPEDVQELAAAFDSALESRSEALARATAARARLAGRLSTDKWLQRVWEVYHLAAHPS